MNSGLIEKALCLTHPSIHPNPFPCMEFITLYTICHLTFSFASIITTTATRGHHLTIDINAGPKDLLACKSVTLIFGGRTVWILLLRIKALSQFIVFEWFLFPNMGYSGIVSFTLFQKMTGLIKFYSTTAAQRNGYMKNSHLPRIRLLHSRASVQPGYYLRHGWHFFFPLKRANCKNLLYCIL